MGVDKALIEVDGRSLAGRVADALATAGATAVAAVGGDGPALSEQGLAVHPDRWPDEGPLGGVIVGLRAVGSSPTVVVLSCDLLAPDPGLIARLARRRARLGCDLVVPQVGGHPQWAHGAWRRSVVDLLADRFASGERSLVGATAGLRVDRVVVEDPSSLADADVPSDLGPVAYDPRRGHP